jgi:adhesin transport system membrane fusion protein
MPEENKPKLPPKLDQEDLEFVDDSRKAMVTESPFITNALLYGIGAFIIVILIWAKFAILDEITVAAGKVIPSSQVQVIQNLDGGIVAAIYVREGDIVQKDQILMRLDDTRYASAYREALAKYWALTASTARLMAEETGAKTITFPQALIQEQPELVKNETLLFNQHVEDLNATLDTLRKSYNLANQELNISKPMVAEGLISQIELLRTEREVNDLQGKISQALEGFQSKAHDQLSEQTAQLASLQEALAGLKDRMVRTTIRSPVYGTVKKINIATIGGVIQPGMNIMEIVPLEDTLLIEARVRPSDIAFIHPGQQAMVKFTAYDFSIYGGLQGTVEYISADTIKDQDNPQDKETYYKILVRTTSNHLGTDEKPLPIIPGMTAMVDIKTGRKSVLDYLLNPIFKASENALRER